MGQIGGSQVIQNAGYDVAKVYKSNPARVMGGDHPRDRKWQTVSGSKFSGTLSLNTLRICCVCANVEATKRMCGTAILLDPAPFFAVGVCC